MKDIEIVGITKVFGKTVAVDDVSLSVEHGEFLTLLGPSGCGKTTILRTIAGFTNPTKGSIFIEGELVNDKPPYKRNIGMVFQSYSLFPHMTTYDNLAFGLKMRKIPNDEIERRVKEAFDLINLSGYEKRYPQQLSGGQQQRVALGRALVIKPNVLLLDEPLSNLDLKLRQKMRLEIKRIQNEVGITTVYVTHDQEEALVMSDCLALMNAGRIEQVGSPEEIYEYPKNKFVADFIGETNFLSGKLLSVTEPIAMVALNNKEKIHASLGSTMYHNVRLENGCDVTVSVRPQKITIVKAISSDKGFKNCFEGRIKEIEYVGAAVKYHVLLENGQMIVAQESLIEPPKYTLGEKVFINCPAENCLIIPETKERLAD